MTNMAAEGGAFTGIIAPDEKTVEYLVAQRGMTAEAARALCAGLYSGEGASYVEEIEIDAASIRPMIALPGDPGNGIHIDAQHGDVRIDIAYAGSCPAGKKDAMDMYAKVFSEALERGERVSGGVRRYTQSGQQEGVAPCPGKAYAQGFGA